MNNNPSFARIATNAHHFQLLRHLCTDVLCRSCPPHVHAVYQGHEALVAIADGAVVQGDLPRRALALVRQWCLDHRAELVQNWERAQALQPLRRIPGADND